MTDLEVGKLEQIGRTSNTDYYRLEEHIIVAMPRIGSFDTGETARENVSFQTNTFRSEGTPGVVVVFFDRMTGQDVDARRVYANEIDPQWLAGSALVGGTFLGRAMASFFMGLSRPRIPTRLFGKVEDAVRWGRKCLADHVKVLERAG
ncbi:MAG: hypothetical protein AAGA48_09240 [Myxococcota bacterium]